MTYNVVLLGMVVLCCLSSMSNAALRVPMKRLHPHITTQQNLTAAVQRSIARIKTIEASIAAAINASKSSSQAFPQDAIEAPVSLGSGEFMMTIGIGTPPAKMVAIVDTGSDLIWTQCQPCTACFDQADPIFDPSQSTTYMSSVSCDSSLCSSLPKKSCTPDCEYLYSYGDGSVTTSGVLSLETLTMLDTSGGKYPIPGIAFGCSHDSQGSFPVTDGLVGLGRGQLSLISQLGSLAESKFSYCLISEHSSASETSPLLFGSAASVGQEAKSTPILTNPAKDVFYYLSLEGISVGNSMANIPEGTFDIKGDGSGGFIIDSGTTFTALPHAAFTAVADILDSAIGLPRGSNASPFNLCYQLSSASATATVPTITFHFRGGADYVISEESSFVTVRENLLCFVMLDMDGSSMGVSIFGNYQQQNYHILYDNAQQMLSFAPADCASL